PRRRLVVFVQQPKGALADDVGPNVDGRAGVVFAQVGIVIIGRSRQVSVTGGQIEGGAIFFHGRIARHSKRHVLVPVLLGDGGYFFVVGGPFLDKTETLGQLRA